tara:strand:- start:33287 stop:33916 length:630 start_codon:yes stop_codon:yes gene_type:complete
MTGKKQLSAWTSTFGSDYLERNRDVSDADMLPRMNGLAGLLRDCPESPESILEVGANIGRNLLAMHRLTDAKLYAVEPFAEAFDALNSLCGDFLEDAAQTAGDQLPHGDNSIDLVFTSGVLIHVAPDDLLGVMTEIHRVARRYIWCNEYFAKQPEEIPYRGEAGLLFKRDFGRYYLELFPELKPVATGFLWSATTPFDDTVWWLFEKPE